MLLSEENEMNPAKLLATIKHLEDKIHELQTGFSAERLKTMGSVISNLEVQVKVLSERHNKDVETIDGLATKLDEVAEYYAAHYKGDPWREFEALKKQLAYWTAEDAK